MAEDNEELLCLEAKHRKEKKELQAQIQALKKAAKNDKTKKKEILTEIATLEMDMENRHKSELDKFEVKAEKEEDPSVPYSDLTESNIVKISKAQKRRDKKSQQEKERTELIKQQEKENISGPRNLETQAITTKLKERQLQIYPIASDGDCLYKAISHQLALTRDQSLDVRELRQDTANYIRKHKDDFIPFMSNPDTFDMLTDVEFDAYCDKIVNTKVWGGQLEIRALSNSLKSQIKVIQASGPESIDQGEEYEGPPLIITYHRHMYSLGEHYNSTQALVQGNAE